jgi:site-specific recombinase XerD
MVTTAPDKLAGLRDRALLLIGFGGALRRSELVALDVADVTENETGLLVAIRHSKTDQEGEGATIAIALGDVACPAKAVARAYSRARRGRLKDRAREDRERFHQASNCPSRPMGALNKFLTPQVRSLR